ncbi:hypothetical protein PHLGIDRAFT_480429 [Phlebiopsis gigantea 11061_1 CR5-6]|uniref:F-box domain-containing protein n=1 Tax=Phlebiopsis gigantea (strain 11061_1 CR5-6) TaxID=745531 RepID=A0A0C3PIV8_PHLG1|nr:hypothetical protein PHLGIDRAFT_480429 [Phlebiopsis gigantea 11061_1 CR5-6]
MTLSIASTSPLPLRTTPDLFLTAAIRGSQMIQAMATDAPGPHLPTELYRHIFLHVPSMRDLCSLSVVCHSMQGEAEFFIYRSVKSSRRSHTEYLCDLITSSPHRHMLVRSLQISNEDTELHLSEARNQEYWERIARLLHDLPRLEVLKISNDMSAPTGNKNAWVLSGCTFSLRHFDSDFVFDAHLLYFLRSQRALETLYWTECFSDDESAEALDRMNIVEPGYSTNLASSMSLLNTNSPRFALKCIPNATLSHIWICGPCAHEDDSWTSYIERFVRGGGAGSLRSLRMNMPYSKGTLVRVLNHLVKGSPELRSLGFIPFFNASDTELIDVLSQFKHLRSLVTWNVIGRDTSRAVAQAIPSLRLVACLHYSYSHEYVILPVNPLGTPKPLHDPDYSLWRDA